MGFFDKLKKMVGISGIKADLVLEKTNYKQGEVINGTVKITGGPDAKHCKKITVTLVEIYPEIQEKEVVQSAPAGGTGEWESTDSSSGIGSAPAISQTRSSQTRKYPEIILAQELDIEANSATDYPVNIQLPAGASVSGYGQEWHLKTEVDIEGAIDAGDTDKITVEPSDELGAAKKAICEAAGFPSSEFLEIQVVDRNGKKVANRIYYL
jgi:sporulation-control protein spo0M